MTIREFFIGGAEILCPVCVRKWNGKSDYSILQIIDSDIDEYINCSMDYIDKAIRRIYILPYNDINFLVLEIWTDE